VAEARPFLKIKIPRLDAIVHTGHNLLESFYIEVLHMLAYLFVVLAVAVRFMPHPWMFTPVVGSLLFFGARGPRRQIWIPFVLLAASDVVLTKLVYHYPFTSDHFVTFAWYAAILWLGTRLGTKTKFVPVIGAALASSISFYLITNLAAWAWLDMYPKNLSGVIMSYVAALPFFRNALAGDLIFTLAMFSTPIALRALSSLRSPSDHAAAA
jgi:hypothetical protein